MCQPKFSESSLQKMCVNWFHIAHPKWFIFSVPNEGKRTKANAAVMKAMGLKSGVADLVVMKPNKIIFIELKTPSGRQSPKQKEFEKVCETLGFQYKIAKSFFEFKKVVDDD